MVRGVAAEVPSLALKSYLCKTLVECNIVSYCCGKECS